MKDKNGIQNSELVASAPVAVSGALGGDFWDEVEARSQIRENAQPEVSARPGVEKE